MFSDTRRASRTFSGVVGRLRPSSIGAPMVVTEIDVGLCGLVRARGADNRRFSSFSNFYRRFWSPTLPVPLPAMTRRRRGEDLPVKFSDGNFKAKIAAPGSVASENEVAVDLSIRSEKRIWTVLARQPECLNWQAN